MSYNCPPDYENKQVVIKPGRVNNRELRRAANKAGCPAYVLHLLRVSGRVQARQRRIDPALVLAALRTVNTKGDA